MFLGSGICSLSRLSSIPSGKAKQSSCLASAEADRWVGEDGQEDGTVTTGSRDGADGRVRAHTCSVVTFQRMSRAPVLQHQIRVAQAPKLGRR